MRAIRLKGYRINKAGKVVRDERRLSVSERLKQRPYKNPSEICLRKAR